MRICGALQPRRFSPTARSPVIAQIVGSVNLAPGNTVIGYAGDLIAD